MPKGVVKKWFPDKGFGFATPKKGGPDVFLHVSSFRRRSVADGLTEGTALRWASVIEGDRGPKAVEIEIDSPEAASAPADSRGRRPLKRRSDPDLLTDMEKVLSQLRVGRNGYTNLGPVLDRVEKIASEAQDKTVFLPALARARDHARDHIDKRWFLLQDVQASGRRPDFDRQEWGKYQRLTESGDHPVIRTLVRITGAPPAYEDDNYEPEWVTNRPPDPPKKPWWKRG